MGNTKGPSGTQEDQPHTILSEDKRQEILTIAYEKLKNQVERTDKSIGEKDSPAKTCAELIHKKSNPESGNYWIDPNGGDKRDAILVYCDLNRKMTCVKSSPERSKNIQYTGDEKEIWLSDISNGMKLTYKTDNNQLHYLQMLSSSASQDVTYHCKKSVAYFDDEKKNYRKSIKMLTWNDAELTARGSHHLRYEVIEDGCKSKSNGWSKTLFRYTTERSTRLPLIDVAIRDIGNSDQEFSIEIGPVCFREQEY